MAALWSDDNQPAYQCDILMSMSTIRNATIVSILPKKRSLLMLREWVDMHVSSGVDDLGDGDIGHVFD